MEIPFSTLEFQFAGTQSLPLFWAIAVTAAFNAAYLLFIWDRKDSPVSRARILMTILIGSLIVVGTYADALAHKPFVMKDCILLAFIGAHGWMAEEMVHRFMQGAAKLPRAPRRT